MLDHYTERKYHIKARRTEGDEWSEWTRTDDYDLALRHVEAIESYGYQAKLKCRGKGTIYVT